MKTSSDERQNREIRQSEVVRLSLFFTFFALRAKSHQPWCCASRGAKLCFSPNKAMLCSKKSYALLRMKRCFITRIQHIPLIYRHLRKCDKIRIFPRKKNFQSEFSNYKAFVRRNFNISMLKLLNTEDGIIKGSDMVACMKQSFM